MGNKNRKRPDEQEQTQSRPRTTSQKSEDTKKAEEPAAPEEPELSPEDLIPPGPPSRPIASQEVVAPEFPAARPVPAPAPRQATQQPRQSPAQHAQSKHTSFAEAAARIPNVAELMKTLVDRQRTADQGYFMVVVPDDAMPRVEQFESIDQLILGIQELENEDVAVFPFLGHYMPISKGPYRYMRTPFGHAMPLFTIPDVDALEFEEHGWLGREQDGEELPPASAPDAADEDLGDDSDDSDSDIDDPEFWADGA